MKKKVVVLLAVFSLLLVIVGCGKSEAVKEKKKASDDVFASGATFYTRWSEDWPEKFKITKSEENELEVIYLENSQQSIVPYETEMQENGHLLYSFKGNNIDGDSTFEDGESAKYIIKIDGKYYFIAQPTVENEKIDLKDYDKIKKRSVTIMREKE